MRAQGLPWTALMDAALAAARQELGATEADVRAACRTVPFDPGLIQVCADLVGAEHAFCLGSRCVMPRRL